VFYKMKISKGAWWT